MVGYKPLQKWFVSVPQHIPKKIAQQDFSGKGEKVTERLTPRLTIALVPPCGNNKEDFVIELIKNGTLRDLANCKTVCWYAQAMTGTS